MTATPPPLDPRFVKITDALAADEYGGPSPLWEGEDDPRQHPDWQPSEAEAAWQAEIEEADAADGADTHPPPTNGGATFEPGDGPASWEGLGADGPGRDEAPGEGGPAPGTAADDRPRLAPVSGMTHTPAFGRDLVPGLIRRRSLSVWASEEGLGKSALRAELGIRAAAGCGPLFGYFDIPAPFRVATFDEENGHDEELRRDDEALATLGLGRDALGDRYQRVSFSGLFLNAGSDRAYLDAEVERTRPDLLILDTAGSMVADEWGAPLKETIRYLRSLTIRYGVAVLLIVHMTKPARDGKRTEIHGTKLGDVMGQWTRSVDVVMLLADLGEGRVRLALTKKIAPVVLVLQQDAGIWRLLNTGETRASRDRNDDRILRAIVGGLTTAEDIRSQLGTADQPMPKRTFYDALRRLRADGLVAEGTPLMATDDGFEAVA